ncbi:MAG: hypothetical protein ACREX6_09730, partial [Casimicrobiaceae bacterium]
AGAHLVSPMAWNGSSGLLAGFPDYVPHTAWRDTPLEEAALDFVLARAGLPPGSRLWTFGSQRHADDDGWTAEVGHAIAAPGRLALIPDREGRVVLASPRGLRLAVGYGITVVAGMPPDAPLANLALEFMTGEADPSPLCAKAGVTDWRRIAAGVLVIIAPEPACANAAPRFADRIRIALRFTTVDPIPLTRIAVLADAG